MVTGQGKPDRQTDWFGQLRRRMLDITRRRVPADEAEDLVQAALGIIVDKTAGRPDLAWSLQVLRNVIGNHYRREGTRKRYLDGSVEPDNVAMPLEALDSEERVRAIEAGLADLASASPDCGRYLQGVMEEIPVKEIALTEGLETNALYQRLYRCRGKLRDILRQKGVLP